MLKLVKCRTFHLTPVSLGIGALGGITSALQGGKFGHGFISAGIGAASGSLKFSGPATSQVVKRTLTAVVVGGTATRISGGKFANGAGTAMFSSLIASAASVVANNHRPVVNAPPTPTPKIPGFESPEIDPITREVQLVDETMAVPRAAPEPSPTHTGESGIKTGDLLGGLCSGTPCANRAAVAAARVRQANAIASAESKFAANHHAAVRDVNTVNSVVGKTTLLLGGVGTIGARNAMTLFGGYGAFSDVNAFIQSGSALDGYAAGVGIATTVIPGQQVTGAIKGTAIDYIQGQQ